MQSLGTMCDDVVYVSLAKAIATSQGYHSIHLVGAPVHKSSRPLVSPPVLGVSRVALATSPGGATFGGLTPTRRALFTSAGRIVAEIVCDHHHALVVMRGLEGGRGFDTSSA